jgi:hypothetical protein
LLKKSLEGEVWVLLHAMEVAIDLYVSIDKILFESDFQLLMRAIYLKGR